MIIRAFGVASLLLAVGCSGDDSPGADNGGTGGSGGTQPQAGAGGTSGSGAGSSAGGAGASGKGVPRGAVSLNVVAAGTCMLESSYVDLPASPGSHPVTATDKGAALENGSMTSDGQSVTVSCTMSGTTSVLFDGTITLKSGADQTVVNVGGYPLVVGQPANGGAVVSGPPLTGSYGAPVQSCTHTAIAVDAEAHSVWVELRCPEFVGNDDMDTCELGTSYYFFENCKGS